jgi:hypothetical protein
MAYTTINDPTIYFNTKLYTGNNTGQSITGVGFQPDWVWIKSRTDTNSHNSWDSVRGVNKYLENDTTKIETTVTNGVTAFGTDGFTVGDRDAINDNGLSLVSWNWKAGTSFTNDASATGIGTIDSSGSVSDASGFSICSFTGTGSNGTIKHGLSTAPRVIIFKQRNGTGYWLTYHAAIGAGTILVLDTNAVKSDSSVWFQSTDPTSSVFSVGTSSNNNGSSNTYIAYCFAEKKGYSKFGSYKGKGNADGPFVYTGFKPACVIIKGAISGDGDAAQNWEMYDNKRDGYNGFNDALFPSTSATESVQDRVDLLSNGFKIVVNSDGVNDNNSTYIYMAWAENPFVAGNFVPGTAR